MLKRLIVYILLKLKWRGKLRFKWSDHIGYHSIFEGMNQIHSNVWFYGYLGYSSYIGEHSSLSGEIGKFTSIAPYVRCNPGKHPYTYPFVSTAPCFFSLNSGLSQSSGTFATHQKFNELSCFNEEKKYAIKIGNDCWIGEGAFIVGGVKISDGAVVLAHAVVTRDIPPYAIVGGVPAKILRYRYSQEDIEFLLKIKWWDNTPEWFKANWELLNDIAKLKFHYNYEGI